MRTHTFYLKNYDLLGFYDLEDARCIYSYCFTDYKGYSHSNSSTSFIAIIKDIRDYVSIFKRLRLKDDIHIYCMNVFWRKVNNALYRYDRPWVKKEIILSKTTLKIKKVITYRINEVETEYHKFNDSFYVDREEYKPEKFEVINLKYREHLITTEHAIYGTEDGKLYTSFEEAVYNATAVPCKGYIERYIVIDIYDPTLSNEMPTGENMEYTLDKIKEIYSRNIAHRTVAIDPDKTKIFYESCYADGFECGFDYGILYGHKILDQFREYRSMSGFNVCDNPNVICETIVTPFKKDYYDCIDRLIEGKDKYNLLKLGSDFIVAQNFFEAKEDYYCAIDSMPSIIPVEDMVPVYDYSKYDRVRVHLKAKDWKENKDYQSFTALGKAVGKDHKHDYLYGQTAFVKELVGVDDFLAFITFDIRGEEFHHCDIPLLEVKYDYMKVVNDNGNITALFDIDASACFNMEEDRDLIIMIPKKKEEA